MKTGASTPIFVPVQPIALPVEQALIVNISQNVFVGERTYGNYRIEGCKPNQAFTTLAIDARRGIIHRGDLQLGKQMGIEQFPILAEDIAVDLVREWNSDIWGIGSTVTAEIAEEKIRGFSGVFVAEAMEPTGEELEQARAILSLSDKALFERAQSEWDQFRRPDMISGPWKRAARRLGMDAEWLYAITNIAALPDCKFCGSKMKTATATVCATCGRDQDPIQLPSVLPKRRQSRKEKEL